MNRKELNENRKQSLSRKFIKNFVKIFIVVSFFIQVSIETTNLFNISKNFLIDKYNFYTKKELVKVPEEVIYDNSDIESVIKRVSKETGLHEVILKALIDAESSGGEENSLYRYEPRVFAQRAKIDSEYSESERKMLASSHGVAHIMGYRAKPDCGVHWSKLYDNYTAIKCSAKILIDNLDSYREISNPSERLRRAYKMYNGSGEQAERYSVKLMAKIGSLLLTDFQLPNKEVEKQEEQLAKNVQNLKFRGMTIYEN